MQSQQIGQPTANPATGGRTGCLIIGTPCYEAGEGARVHVWWDYDLIARRALGIKTLDGYWPNRWAEVLMTCMGAVAVSRPVYIAVPDLSAVLKHPYVNKQLQMRRLAVYIGQSTARHGVSAVEIEHLKRSLIAASAAMGLPTLETLDDARAWAPGHTQETT